MTLRASLLVLVAALLLGAPAVAAAADAPTATVGAGKLRGTDDGKTTRFLGVPYAQPPTGERRLRPPRPAKAWKGTRAATRKAKSCVQTPNPEAPKGTTSEDCLYLNVTRPSAQPEQPRPVMVWLHGGGGTIGNGAEYDARRLAEQGDVVVVTVNYRLGALGSLSLPGMKQGGTFGLLDMVAALRWTKRNAAAFGGDARNVTAFGESNGGFAICGLLTSPAAKGLFDKASMASGNCAIDFPKGGFAPGVPALHKFLPKAAADAAGKGVAKSLGCTTAACLRKLPAKRFTKAPLDFYATGTPALPRTPAAAAAAGKVADVPVIIGTNRDEANGPVGAAVSAKPITAKQYPKLLRTAFGKAAPAIEREYPLTDGDLPAQTYARVMTDAAWTCTTATTRDGIARTAPTYAYEFADPNAPNVNGVKREGFRVGAAHASDVPSLFDLQGKSLLTQPGQPELAATMVGYWTRFARTGDPNGAGAPAWARYAGDGQVLGLAPEAIAPVDSDTEHRCAFWGDVAS